MTLTDAIVYEGLAADWRRLASKYAAEGMSHSAERSEIIARIWDRRALAAHKAAIEVVPDHRMATLVAA